MATLNIAKIVPTPHYMLEPAFCCEMCLGKAGQGQLGEHPSHGVQVLPSYRSQHVTVSALVLETLAAAASI